MYASAIRTVTTNWDVLQLLWGQADNVKES